MSAWPNPDPHNCPAYPSEHCDAEAWERATNPELAAQEPSIDLAITPELMDMAEQMAAAGEPVERFRAVCEFDAASLYQSLPPSCREGFWQEAREKGHARVLDWLSRQELEIRSRRAARKRAGQSGAKPAQAAHTRH